MPRIRYLKPSFFLDEDVATLQFWVRLLYQGLWVLADKAGRLEDRPKRIKAEIFPYDDGVDVEDGLKTLSQPKPNGVRPFIHRYEMGGERYIQIVMWEEHQSPHHTERESSIPGPDQKVSSLILPLSKIKRNNNGDGKLAQSEYGVKERLKNRSLTVKQPTKSVNDEFIEGLKANPGFKHINLDAEFAKMDAWLSLPRNKGRKKTPMFILNWLNKIEAPVEQQPTAAERIKAITESHKPPGLAEAEARKREEECAPMPKEWREMIGKLASDKSI